MNNPNTNFQQQANHPSGDSSSASQQQDQHQQQNQVASFLRQQQQQQQSSGMMPGAGNNGLNLQDLKRLQQQLQEQQQAAFPNALLRNSGGSNSAPNHNHNDLLQSLYLDQKIHSGRLDHGMNAMNPMSSMNMNMNPMMAAAAGMNGMNNNSNSNAMNQLLAMQSMMMFPQQQNHLQAEQQPLPSPHSLFHRDGSRRMRGGVIEPFPEKLHRLLCEVEAMGQSDIISFVANGRAFCIHQPDAFFRDIVPLYFRQSRLSSFKRQLNLYGFELINTGPARGGYYHELFVKERPELCRRMRRVAVKVSSSKNDATVSKDSHHDDVVKKDSTTTKSQQEQPPVKPQQDKTNEQQQQQPPPAAVAE
jgi:hypothetical protein